MNRQNCHFVVIWEFWVRAGAEERFEAGYGPRGAWVRLFTGDPEYGDTQLVRDSSEPRRYLTLDSWSSESAYEAFRKRHSAEYAAIDTECEGWTVRETEIGRFGVLSR